MFLNIIDVLLDAVRQQLRVFRQQRKATPLINRLYVYSIVFDPFLFFVLLGQAEVGFNLSISRIFAVAFYVAFFLTNSRVKKISPVKLTSVYLGNLTWLGTYLVLAYLITVIFGFNYLIHFIPAEIAPDLMLRSILSAPYVRAVTEFVAIAIVIFHYFWVGPRMLISECSYKFLASTFLLLCYLSISVGIINFASGYLFGSNFLPSHLMNFLAPEIVTVGARYQGLAGEPRDAVGQLVLFIVLFKFFSITEIFRLSQEKQRAILYISLLCIILTFSASGLFGFAIFCLFYVCYKLIQKMSVLNLIKSFLAIIFLILFIYLSLIHVERFSDYVGAYQDLIQILEGGGELPELIKTQLVNFYPSYAWFKLCIAGEFGSCIFGGGLGTSFALNSLFYTDSLANPHATISRLIPELGVLGMCLFIYVSLKPIFSNIRIQVPLHSKLSKSNADVIGIGLLALLAFFLGHKSNIFYFGVLAVAVGLYHFNSKANNN